MVACVEEDTVHLARSTVSWADTFKIHSRRHRRAQAVSLEMELLEDQGPPEPTHEQIARVAEGHQNHGERKCNPRPHLKPYTLSNLDFVEKGFHVGEEQLTSSFSLRTPVVRASLEPRRDDCRCSCGCCCSCCCGCWVCCSSGWEVKDDVQCVAFFSPRSPLLPFLPFSPCDLLGFARFPRCPRGCSPRSSTASRRPHV